MTMKFKDAAFWYNQESHQMDAWDYLQEHVDVSVLEHFTKIYRKEVSIHQYDYDNIPKVGVDLIKKYEGCKLKAYYDPGTGGLPITIGWGSTSRMNGQPFRIGDTITQEEADKLLYESLLKKYLPQLERIPHWENMNDNQRGALLSFAYNLGAYFYGGANFETITRVLKNGEWNKVPDALYLYRNPGSRVEEGLRKRRIEEGNLWSKSA